MRATGEFHRRIKNFLEDEYGITDVRFVSGGKHPKVCFSFAGQEHQRVIAASPSDHRALANDLADLRRLLGPPPTAKPPGRKSLDDLTNEVGTKALAVRTVSAIQDLAAPVSPKPDAAVAEQTPSLAVRFATDIAIHNDGEEYDLIFRARRKTAALNGIITSSLRPVAAVTLPLASILTLFDTIEPIAREARPVPQIQAAPKPLVETAKPSSIIPRGFAMIMQLAEKYAEGRRIAIEQTGSQKGGLYNKHISVWLKKNGFADIRSHDWPNIGMIANHLTDIRQWSVTQPAMILADLRPKTLLRLWKERPIEKVPVKRRSPTLRKAANGVDGAPSHSS